LTRPLAFLAFLAYAATGGAEQIKSPREAWIYLSQPNKSARWVLIASTRNDGYFQCENLDTFVRCPVPIWIKRLPVESKRYASTNSRSMPHPDIAGSELRRFLTDAQATAAKNAFRRLNLAPDDVYSQIHDERRRIVGTAYDIGIVLKLDFREFEKLVEAYMLAVWGTSIKDGYTYETD
jgi:hypothetical protein